MDLEEEPWLERFLKESGELGTGVGNEHDSEPWLRYAETVTGTKAGPPGEEDVRYRWLGVVVLFAALVGLAWALWKFAWQHWHS